MKFIYHYQTKWHDTDANREVRPSQVLAYMMETSNFHLIGEGMSLDDLRDTRGLAFFLSRVALRLYHPLYANEEIDVETWVCESRGLSFHRCFRVLRGDTVIAEAFTVWALLDLHAKKMLPVSEFPYDIEPELPLETPGGGRIRMPSMEVMQEVGERKIVYSDIDYNGHMNNTHYPDMLCDFTPGIRARRAVGITLSFLGEATFGHVLRVLRADRGEHEFYFRTVNEEGKTCLEAMLITEPIESVQ